MTRISDDARGRYYSHTQKKSVLFPDDVHALLKSHSKFLTIEDVRDAIMNLDLGSWQPNRLELEKELTSMKALENALRADSDRSLDAIHEYNKRAADICTDLALKVPYYEEVADYVGFFTSDQKWKVENLGKLMQEKQVKAQECIDWKDAPKFVRELHRQLRQIEVDKSIHDERCSSTSDLIDVVAEYRQALQEKLTRRILVDQLLGKCLSVCDEKKKRSRREVCDEKKIARPRIHLTDTAVTSGWMCK